MTVIWLVEDDPSIGPGLVRTLQAEGHVVKWAASVAESEGLEGSPDLLLVDLGLPDGDGLDVCRRLSDRHPHMRAVILTARTSEIDIVMGRNAGAVDFISKPFRLAELLATIRAQLGDRTHDRIAVGDLVAQRAAPGASFDPPDELCDESLAGSTAEVTASPRPGGIGKPAIRATPGASTSQA